jgi:site-specific recombinase XerD
MSDKVVEGRSFWRDKAFAGIHCGEAEPALFLEFLEGHDFRPNTLRAFSNDLRGFMLWFTERNGERFVVTRVSTRDVTDFKTYQRNEKGLAVATVNRSLVTIRKFFGWLVDRGLLPSNPAVAVKELKRVELAPQGLEAIAVRRLLRECELRRDVRATAIFNLFLYTGARVSELAGLTLADIVMSDRSGSVTFRDAKGGKQRTCPLPLPARRALQAWLDVRPPVATTTVFIGCRGALKEDAVRKLCDKYSAILGVRFHPHTLRHSMASRYLADNQNDLVGLSMLLGHESLNTTRRYSLKTAEALAEGAERMVW